jgi:hypothetical protein
MRTDGCSTFAPKTIPWRDLTPRRSSRDQARPELTVHRKADLWAKQDAEEVNVKKTRKQELEQRRFEKEQREIQEAVTKEAQKKCREMAIAAEKARIAKSSEPFFASSIGKAVVAFNDLIQTPSGSKIYSRALLKDAIDRMDIKNIPYFLRVTINELQSEYHHRRNFRVAAELIIKQGLRTARVAR